MAPISTAGDVVRHIAAECVFVDERGGVGNRLEPAAAIEKQYAAFPARGPAYAKTRTSMIAMILKLPCSRSILCGGNGGFREGPGRTNEVPIVHKLPPNRRERRAAAECLGAATFRRRFAADLLQVQQTGGVPVQFAIAELGAISAPHRSGKKMHHLQVKVGHYGVFHGRRWQTETY
jgi:hypothetical protein